MGKVNDVGLLQTGCLNGIIQVSTSPRSLTSCSLRLNLLNVNHKKPKSLTNNKHQERRGEGSNVKRERRSQRQSKRTNDMFLFFLSPLYSTFYIKPFSFSLLPCCTLISVHVYIYSLLIISAWYLMGMDERLKEIKYGVNGVRLQTKFVTFTSFLKCLLTSTTRTITTLIMSYGMT